jgi:3-oxoisoapionate decarboxylase
MVSLSNVGCTFDPANFARCREDPVAAYAILKQYVMYLQLKDLRWIDTEPQFCAIGEGGIQWNRLLDELFQNYTGYWGIEYEDPSDIMEGTRKCIKALLQFRRTLKFDQAQRSDSTHP